MVAATGFAGIILDSPAFLDICEQFASGNMSIYDLQQQVIEAAQKVEQKVRDYINEARSGGSSNNSSGNSNSGSSGSNSPNDPNKWRDAVEKIKLTIKDSQLGKKWGKHKFDYPNMKSYNEYKKLAQDVFSNPDKIVFDAKNGEYYYIKGSDLLRVSTDGDFVSLYPFKNIPTIVNTAISEGGLL